MDEIEGELIAHRVVGDDFWSIATIRTVAGNVAVTGKLLGVQVGDSVVCSGTWNDHPKFGLQLKAKKCTVTIPQTDNGVIAWLADGKRFEGIGPATARALLDHFGGAKTLWRIIEKYPERLAEVKGISKDRAESIHRAYARYVHDRESMIKFRSWGMTEHQIVKMLQSWGDAAESKLRENPYQLAEMIDGFGFLRADNIAQRMGMPLEAEPRIRCGLMHTMEQAQGHGHCYVAKPKLLNMATEKVLRLGHAPHLVAAQLKVMSKAGDFVSRQVPRTGKKAKPGETVEGVYDRKTDKSENHCAKALARMLSKPDRTVEALGLDLHEDAHPVPRGAETIVTVTVSDTVLGDFDDHGNHVDVPSVCVTCERCDHAVEIMGQDEDSVTRGCATLREECPNKEANYYVTRKDS